MQFLSGHTVYVSCPWYYISLVRTIGGIEIVHKQCGVGQKFNSKTFAILITFLYTNKNALTYSCLTDTKLYVHGVYVQNIYQIIALNGQ